MPTPPAVDPCVLGALVARLGERGPALRTTLLQTWQTETTQRLADLAAACGAGDVDGVLRLVHALRGSSAALGAVALAERCGQVEQGLRGGAVLDLPSVEVLVRDEALRAAAAFADLP